MKSMNRCSADTQAPLETYFLNRLALDKMMAPRAINLYQVLEEVYAFAEVPTLQDFLDQFCEAAVSEKYGWKQGSPGNLLYFAEILEFLVEVGYLLNRQTSPKSWNLTKRDVSTLPGSALPVRLTSQEYRQPRLVLRQFFRAASLPAWKLTLHNWLESALSNFSIVENTEPAGLLAFRRYFEKLVEAGYLILARWRENKTGRPAGAGAAR
ncbi:MAG TPA: hypothetical protein VG870_05130 [Chitinophagaceae bacterium]|nr:hypothetical protein [Chitinophagaceae bacterium]